jgi:hypothetical protein
MSDLPIGTIVRLGRDTGLAVVVPNEWAGNYHQKWQSDGFVRLLGGNDYPYVTGQSVNGGWWLTYVYSCEIVPEEEVPDHIQALAMRCLLDPTFVPEIEA